MKRFLAFAYDSYYPSGAKADFVGDYDTVGLALLATSFNGIAQHDFLDVLDTLHVDWLEYVRGPEGWQVHDPKTRSKPG